MKLSRILRRDPETPTLRERVANLRAGLSCATSRERPKDEAGPSRRAMVAGTLVAAMPLPVIAPTTAAAPKQAHPDQALLDAGAALASAQEAQQQAEAAYRVANHATYQVLLTRPAALLPLTSEYRRFSPPHGRSAWGNVRFRWVPPGEDDLEDGRWSTVAWTGEGLRHVIARAVPVMGAGGQTPHRIRCWRSLLPLADSFNARVEAIEAETDYRRLRVARETARETEENCRRAAGDLDRSARAGIRAGGGAGRAMW